MTAWEAELKLAREGVTPARVLLGSWVGEGVAHGEQVRASMSVREVLGGAQIEVWERVGEHEDVCFYRFDIGGRQVRVVHLMATAVTEYAVELGPGTLAWVTPPKVPGVVWSFDGAVLTTEVWWPDAPGPEVVVRYRRV